MGGQPHTVLSPGVWSTLGILAILCVLLVILYLYLRRQKAKGILSKEEVVHFELGSIPPALADNDENDSLQFEKEITRLPYNKKFEIPKEKFTFQQRNILEKGRYSTVYRGTVATGTDQHVHEIALKVAKKSKRDAVKCVLDEIKRLCYIEKHENIVQIIGACTVGIKQGEVYLATEFCSLGNLQKYLHFLEEKNFHRSVNIEMENEVNCNSSHSSEKYLNEMDQHNSCDKANGASDLAETTELLRFAQEIASGMDFLASKNMVHGDICCQNVLLDSKRTAKITNVCVSKRKNVYINLMRQNMDPIRWQWLAHESIARLEFTSQSDVWSFGVTIFEIYSLGKVPYENVPWDKKFADRLSGGIRAGRPTLAGPEIYDTMLSCWKLEPEERPSFLILQEFLQNYVQSKNA